LSVIPHRGISVGAIDVAVEEPQPTASMALASPGAIQPRRVSSRIMPRLCRSQSDRCGLQDVFHPPDRISSDVRIVGLSTAEIGRPVAE
jgi:hypothetical protein